MARIIGGIGTSHVPTIGLAYDKGKQEQPAWAPLFEGYKPVAAWLEEQRPDVLVFFYNDHASTFFFDFYPTFALGVSPTFPIADEGAGPRALPPIKGHPGLAAHLADCLVNDEFDLTLFQDKALDHGCLSPLPLLWPHRPDWPGAIVPIEVNVLQYPLPTARRCYRLGQAVRRAVESYPEALKVAVVGTGGLSHQIHGERTGFNNTDWDMRFLQLLQDDPLQLTELTHAELTRLGGAESVEVIMWLAMRGALSDRIVKRHANYYLATTTAMAVALFEDTSAPATPSPIPEHYQPNPQLAGIDQIPGTYPFDIRQSVKAIKLNRFLWQLADPEHRARFQSDEDQACRHAGLSEEERALVRGRDWLGLVKYGVNFFVLEKLARTWRMSNLEMYAQMRGETLEAFLHTRRVPEAQ
ncbi:MAG: gallate dioxygenase [Steroidobacterales bacterium]